jgi:3-methylcrotonyl-CoA carboxylase alpha subunit
MNTRLQVEHPVTEAITRLDLVEWQFRIAAGEPLPMRQDDVPLRGHAIEARLYAEDTEHGFLPSSGRLLALRFPETVRVDIGVEVGGEVTRFYDPMIAKLIAHAPTREQALEQLTAALEQTIIAGPRTNLSFLSALCRAPEFRAGAVDTGFIEAHLSELGAEPHGIDRAAAALGVRQLLARAMRPTAGSAPAQAWTSPWDAEDGFQLTGVRQLSVPVLVDGERILAAVCFAGGLSVAIDGVAPAVAIALDVEDAVYVLRGGRQTIVRLPDIAGAGADSANRQGAVRAPMHGKVLDVLVDHGAAVVKGQRLAIIEAMKMEHVLTAPHDGTVTELAVQAGAQVSEGAVVMQIQASEN